MNLDHITDTMDFINDHKVYRYLYLVAVSYIWIKFKATKLYAMIAIWIFRRHLIDHQLFDNMDMLTIQIPSQIKNLGKKHVFTDMLRTESGLFMVFLKSYIRRLCKIDHGKKEIEILNRSIMLPAPMRKVYEFFQYIGDFDYTTDSLPRKLLTDYDIFLRDLPEIFENGLYDKLEINQKQVIRWLRNNREKPVATDSDSEEIRETLQRRQIKLLVSKYDGIMFDYRIQIKKNLALQITSELNMYDQIKAILKYGFQSVYKAMEVSFPRKVNEINGELSGIIYDGFDCGES